MARRVIVLLAAVSSLLLGACSVTSPTKDSSGTPTQLQFSAKTLEGRPFSGASLLGRPAVLWFWAPWCPACQGEAPQVSRVAKANPTVTFVGVGSRDQLPALKEFVEKYNLGGFTELDDADAAVWAKFGVTRQPAYAFVTPDGDVDVVRGSLSETDLTSRVQALTNK